MKKLIFPLLFIFCFSAYLWGQAIGPGAGMIGGLPSSLYQPLDSDLTMIGGLTPVQNKVLIGNSTPAWSVSSWTITTPTTGGVYYGSSTSAISVLAAGTQNKVLQMGASVPAWSSFTMGSPGGSATFLRSDGTNWSASAYTIATPTTGGLLYGSGTGAWANLAAGTQNYVFGMGATLPDYLWLLDTGSLSTNSDTRIPSQKAVKTYADLKIAGPGTVTTGYIVAYQGTTGLAVSTGVDPATFVMTNNGVKLPTVTKAFADTGYTALSTDFSIIWNAVGGACVQNLPAATGTGRILEIKKVDASANTVTITTNGAELLDGFTTQILTAQWEAITIQDTAVGVWHIL